MSAHLGLSGQFSSTQSAKSWDLSSQPSKDRFELELEYEKFVMRTTPHLSMSDPVFEVGGSRRRTGDFHQRSHTMCDPSVPVQKLEEHPILQGRATVSFSVGIDDFQGELYIHSPNVEGAIQQLDRDHLYIIPAGTPRGRVYWKDTGGGAVYCPVVQMQLQSKFQPDEHKQRRFADYTFDAAYEPLVYLPFMTRDEQDCFLFGRFRGIRRLLCSKGDHGRFVSAELALHLTAIHHKQNKALELENGRDEEESDGVDGVDDQDSNGVNDHDSEEDSDKKPAAKKTPPAKEKSKGSSEEDHHSEDDSDNKLAAKKTPPAKANSKGSSSEEEDDSGEDSDDKVECLGSKKGSPKKKPVWSDDSDDDEDEQNEDEEDSNDGSMKELEKKTSMKELEKKASTKTGARSTRKNPSESPLQGTLSTEKAKSKGGKKKVGGGFLGDTGGVATTPSKTTSPKPAPKPDARKRGRAKGKAQSKKKSKTSKK